VFREVRRVLKPHGTAWLNMGDAYAGSDTRKQEWLNTGVGSRNVKVTDAVGGFMRQVSGLKPKDLIGLPWRVAFALQADGWWLRSDIVWSKPNPMPESVTDRPTKAHEYIFLLAKQGRYYYDAEAISEAQTSSGLGGFSNKASLKTVLLNASHKPSLVNARNDGRRNRRSVWEIATQPYPDAHFATFPEALVEPCILAGSPPGGTVLDPFMGSGTVGAVAQRLGRRAVGTEMNADYIALAAKRISAVPLPMDLV
jgi:DNA modification methylase